MNTTRTHQKSGSEYRLSRRNVCVSMSAVALSSTAVLPPSDTSSQRSFVISSFWYRVSFGAVRLFFVVIRPPFIKWTEFEFHGTSPSRHLPTLAPPLCVMQACEYNARDNGRPQAPALRPAHFHL
ncbi:hypothetical protein ACTXHA_03985 [Burkholderia cenocepacia]